MQRFGLLGRTLGHSFSPAIHQLLGHEPYDLYPVEPENLPDFLQNTELSGFNITIPYKKSVVPYCAALTRRAALLGNVNTLPRAEGVGAGQRRGIGYRLCRAARLRHPARGYFPPRGG